MAEPKDQCVEPAVGPILEVDEQTAAASGEDKAQGGIAVKARVGKPAPDFEASAYLDGGFVNIRLSDYKGKWVVLCFYPGDFTFV
jgi:peroxiredoxin (alkyl hydroperoxide reductase subunit C)